MRNIHLVLVALIALSSASPAAVEAGETASETWRVDGSFSYRRFEQQFKPEVGGLKGERLVEESELCAGLLATWRVLEHLDVGAYLRFDTGSRQAGRFAGFEAGRTRVDPSVGGAFSELWIGPLLRTGWKWIFLELGYGAFGLRDDEARADLSTAVGDTSTPLRTLPTVAYLANLGVAVPLDDRFDLVLRLEYRVRYYDRRGEVKLVTADGDPVVHGTQNFTPLLGLRWKGKAAE
jgi:hypothetical protein